MARIGSKVSSASKSSAARPAPMSMAGSEHIAQENMKLSSKRQKNRHRASVACASCRDRRIRCVVPSGHSGCDQCRRTRTNCIIKNDDERRRPISRAYMTSLADRIALLENMLKEKGAELPPANHPPKTRHPPLQDDTQTRKTCDTPSDGLEPTDHSDNVLSGGQQTPPSACSDNGQEEQQHFVQNQKYQERSIGSPQILSFPTNEGMVKRLLSTRGHLSFDQLSGRLRYFGPTTNFHVHSDDSATLEDNSKSQESLSEVDSTIQGLSPDTAEYLMELFWKSYNSVLHVIHKEAFNEDREKGRRQFYSRFLHVCAQAMGYRFADKSRADIQQIALPHSTRESTLHHAAKRMLDDELERPGGVTSVVALLLLSDLECGAGRDTIGWMYGGMAVRLAFDIGLHLDSRDAGLSEREIAIRQMTLWACVIYDKYWALFLGRPTSMKSSDLEIYHLGKQFERLGTCQPAGPQMSLETRIYEALLDLMELTGKITEHTEGRLQNHAKADRNAYKRMTALDKELNNWYNRLPHGLKWTAKNVESAPFSFFLLHQQYHCLVILLHRPFARYEDTALFDSEDSGETDARGSVGSRDICTKHAISISRIFWQHRHRFDTKEIFVTGLQHAGTAATALVAALASIKDPGERHSNMKYLECLAGALKDMIHAYQPAQRMFTILTAVVTELRGAPPEISSSGLYTSQSPIVPARRASAIETGSQAPRFKRRNTNTSPLSQSSHFRFVSFSNPVTTVSLSRDLTSPTASTNMDLQSTFGMISPGTEIPSWMPSTATSFAPCGVSITPSSLASQPQHSQAWMDPSNVSHLPEVHFPEINLAEQDNSHLDYMSLGSDEWRNWQRGGMDGIGLGHVRS